MILDLSSLITDISDQFTTDGIAARCESVLVHCKADGLCEKASVVSTQSCPASKVASSCPCCCHSNRKGPGCWRNGSTSVYLAASQDALQQAFSKSAEVTQFSGQNEI